MPQRAPFGVAECWKTWNNDVAKMADTVVTNLVALVQRPEENFQRPS